MLTRQLEATKTELSDIQSKQDLAAQKIANLERENMKLYRMTIELRGVASSQSKNPQGLQI
jgi:hypothetical protein